MFYVIADMWPLLWPFNHVLRIKNIDSYIKMSGVDTWHLYAIKKRYKRPHVCLACSWIDKTLDKGACIFEAGCGSGINLLWLGKRGFMNIYGADLSFEAVALAHSLSNHLNIKMDIKQDNSLYPKYLPKSIDGLLSVNWLYHLPNATLDNFFIAYKPFLSSKAKIVFDMVDASYNEARNNIYHTDDWHLPKEKRRPSEYPLRLSQDEIAGIVELHKFRVVRSARVWGMVPRTVWLVENIE